MVATAKRATPGLKSSGVKLLFGTTGSVTVVTSVKRDMSARGKLIAEFTRLDFSGGQFQGAYQVGTQSVDLLSP
jgi:hypothetical protein